jgi:arsenate reductase
MTRFKILFLCYSNAARSILCEYLIHPIAPLRFESYSAGVKPSGEVNPLVVQYLKEQWKVDASKARSKSTDEFKDVHFDFVITVCDESKDACPTWPGQPIVAHWSLPDPATFTGTESQQRDNIHQVALKAKRRLELFTSLPFEKLERLKLSQAVSDIGQTK